MQLDGINLIRLNADDHNFKHFDCADNDLIIKKSCWR